MQATQQQDSEADRKRRIRRNAWLLALLALGFYMGFIVMSLTKG